MIWVLSIISTDDIYHLISRSSQAGYYRMQNCSFVSCSYLAISFFKTTISRLTFAFLTLDLKTKQNNNYCYYCLCIRRFLVLTILSSFIRVIFVLLSLVLRFRPSLFIYTYMYASIYFPLDLLSCVQYLNSCLAISVHMMRLSV